MKTVQEIYTQYRLPAGLHLHQLRVASVAKLLCGSFPAVLAVDDVLKACLFHDMGNIIKFDTDTPGYGPLWGSEPMEYWKKVKQEYIDMYGPSEHKATVEIVKELGLSESVSHYIESIGFQNLESTRDSDSYELKICEYADLRVGPFGVLSLRDRIEDMRMRYQGRHHADMPEDAQKFEELTQAAFAVEKQIFDKTSLKPSDINDASVALIMEALRGMEIGLA